MALKMATLPTCPVCHATLDAASTLSGHAPTPGDLSVCFYCEAFLQFDAGYMLQLLSAADLAALPAYARAALQRATRLIAKAKATLPRPN